MGFSKLIRTASFFSMEMNIYAINKTKQSPGTMAILGARDTKKVIAKSKN